MSSISLQWFEIGILDYSRATKQRASKNAFKVVKEGVPQCTDSLSAGWRYKKIDLPDKVPFRTVFRQFKTYKQAKRCADNLGSVLFCRKVDSSFYFNKIEYLNLKQTPRTVEITKEDEFILNAEGELTPTQMDTKTELEQKYEIEIVD